MSTPNTTVVRSAPIAIAANSSRTKTDLTRIESNSSLSADMSTPASLDSQSTRSRRPCDACRRRKSKCVIHEGQTSCVSCQFHSQDCTFIHSPQPRKRKLNSDNGTVSKRRSPERTEDRKRRPIEALSASNTTPSNSLIEDMANIGGPTILKRSLGLQNDRYSQYIGPTTDFEPSLIELSPFDPQDESLLSRGTLRKVGDRDTFLMLPDYTTPGYDHIQSDIEAIEAIVAPHGRTLLDLYFRVIHPNFPILQKNVILEKYERSLSEFSPPALAAIYILAINWWDHSEELASLPRPNLSELERLARATLADAMYRPKLSTVQAGLLLSQRPDGDQWAPTAQLVAISQELGLHLDCSHWKIPLWERGLRKRLAWALYMQDKWGALVHGRPSHIFAANWAVKPLTEHDFPDLEHDEQNEEESAEHERGRMLFGQMIELSQILAEVLETFYTLSAMDSVDKSGAEGTHLVLSLAKPVQLKLKEWFAALPPCLRMDNPTPSDRLSSIGFLHLAYFATEITLHRRIVRSLSPPSASSIDPYVLYICRSAAKTRLISAMDFVNRLTPQHLRSFWYFASKTNFALIGTFGSLLWATAPGKEEAEFYRMRLAEYRWTLSVSSKGVKGLTDFAMGMLDTSTGLLKALPDKPALSRRGSEGEREQKRALAASRGRALVEGYVLGFGTGSAVEEGTEGPRGEEAVGMASGLVSPSTSSGSVEGDDYMGSSHYGGQDEEDAY